MHVITVALGSRGDVYPLLGFGRALQAKGHKVTIITWGIHEADVRASGLDYVALIDADTYNEVLTWSLKTLDGAFKKEPFSDFRHRLTPEEKILFERAKDISPEGIFKVIEELNVPGETVLATSELFCFGAATLAHEKLGIPYASVWHTVGWYRVLQPMLPKRLRRMELATRNFIMNLFWPTREWKRNFNRIREAMGLPHRKNYTEALLYSQQLNIGLFPRWYAPWFKGGMPNTVLSDFPVYVPDGLPELPAEVTKFLDRPGPVVLFTRASWETGKEMDAYYKTSVAAVKALGVRAIILAPDAVPFAEGRDDLLIADSVHFHKLLKQVQVVVHHGGLGTSIEALANGVPQLIVPGSADQPYNGRDMWRLGVARMVKRTWYKRLARRRLKQLLTDEKFLLKAREVAQKFRTEPEFSIAINRLESLLERSRWQRGHAAASGSSTN